MSDFNSTHNRFVWMDIPVRDLDRACAFYAGVLAVAVPRDSFEGFEFAVIDHKDGNGGCLVVDPDAISSERGPLVYLNVAGRLADAVARTVALGGRVTRGVHAIGPHGHRALIIDSEGNRLALHSPNDD